MALAGLATYDCSSSDEGTDSICADLDLNKHDNPNAAPKTSKIGIKCHTTSEDPFSDVDSDTGSRTGAAYFYEDESSDDDEDSDQANTQRDVDYNHVSDNTLPNPLKLPAPTLGTTTHKEGTVFGNKYADNEKAKLAILEKHVAMTEETPTNNRVCFKHRKGQCKRGKNCRYSHDLGFQAPAYAKIDNETEEQCKPARPPIDEDNSRSSMKRRPGVTNTLNPAKRAKQSLDEQRRSQRPWTVGK